MARCYVHLTPLNCCRTSWRYFFDYVCSHFLQTLSIVRVGLPLRVSRLNVLREFGGGFFTFRSIYASQFRRTRVLQQHFICLPQLRIILSLPRESVIGAFGLQNFTCGGWILFSESFERTRLLDFGQIFLCEQRIELLRLEDKPCFLRAHVAH